MGKKVEIGGKPEFEGVDHEVSFKGFRSLLFFDIFLYAGAYIIALLFLEGRSALKTLFQKERFIRSV